MSSISVAISGKGPRNALRRGMSIARRYGITSNKIDQALSRFAAVLRQFDCSATFPITAVALARSPDVVRKYQVQGIGFAIHGYRHVDHSQLSLAVQSAHLRSATRAFARAGIEAQGFRSPYLRWNDATLTALQQQGFAYDSSQALAWDVLDGHETPAYLHVLDFYKALSASDYPSLPSLRDNLVCIPYTLPDDEAIVERLALTSSDEGSMLWQAILKRTHDLGELFTLGLHPERIVLCQKPLADTLAAARSLSPPVWIARLDEIAAWWRARAVATVETSDAGANRFRVVVDGPPGTTVLTRAVRAEAPVRPWADGYQQVDALSFTVQADRRPFVGIAPHSSDRLVRFLRQQGYLVEIAPDAQPYALYIDQSDLTEREERALLARLEETVIPLVRLGRWPRGAYSALAITGDIDALTLWDYGLRLFGR